MSYVFVLALLVAAEPETSHQTPSGLHSVDRMAMDLLHERIRLAEMQESFTEAHPALQLQQRRVERLEAVLARMAKSLRKPKQELVLRQLQALLAEAAAELELASDVYTREHPRFQQLELRAAALEKVSQQPE